MQTEGKSNTTGESCPLREKLTCGAATLTVENRAPRLLRVDWTGRSNLREPAQVLEPFWERLASWAVERDLEVEMSFVDLDFFNSSTVTALIHLIQRLRERSRKLSIIYNANVRWQVLTFDALRAFETTSGLLSIRGVGK